MPSARSTRVAERKRSRNLPLRTQAKTFIAKARRLINSNDLDEAERVVKNAVVSLDKAAQKGAIHRKNAARRKSRLAKQLNNAKGR